MTYVGLAVLMAVGLVGAGVGSGTSGGLFDLFGGGGGGSGNSVIDKRIKAAEKTLKVNPKDQAALVSLVRSHYSLASSDTNQQTGQFGKDGKKELVKAGSAWQRYVATNPKKPNASVAGLMVVAYSQVGLNQPSNAVGAAEIVADKRNDAQSYLQLADLAQQASQTRKAQLAAQKAVKLAPKSQKKAVQAQVKSILHPQQGAGTPAPAAGGGG